MKVPRLQRLSRTVVTVLAVAVLLGACATGPELPPPAAGTGHVVVGMRLIEKTVDDTNVSDEYAVRRERHITGKTLPDMVVVLEDGGITSGPGFTLSERMPERNRSEEEVTLGADGFSRRQLLLNVGGSLTLINKREVAVTILGFTREGHEIAADVEPGATSTIPVTRPGAYELVTEADNGAYAVLHVIDGAIGWVGSSDAYAVFADMPPGNYRATVIQSRTSGWGEELTLTANGRVNLTAELKVAKRR